MKFKCDMCGKTFKVEQQTDIEQHLKYTHSFQDIPLIKEYSKLIFKIHQESDTLYGFRGLLENER